MGFVLFSFICGFCDGVFGNVRVIVGCVVCDVVEMDSEVLVEGGSSFCRRTLLMVSGVFCSLEELKFDMGVGFWLGCGRCGLRVCGDMVLIGRGSDVFRGLLLAE